MKRRNSSTPVRTKVRQVRNVVLFLLASANILLILLMLTSACGVWIAPQSHPALSCVGYPFSVFQVLNFLFLVFWVVFYWRLAVIPVAGMLLSLGASRTNFPLNFPSAPPAGAFKVLSYNVQGFGDLDMTYTEQNPGPIVDYILGSGAGIVCLQEAYQLGQLDSTRLRRIFSREFPYQEWATAGMKDSCSIIAVLSRYPILSAENIDYHSKSNGSVACRLLIDGDTVLVVNNHLESNRFADDEKDAYKEMLLDPNRSTLRKGYSKLYGKLIESAAVRGVQADSVHAYIERQRERLKIVCGDFNAPPVSYVHHTVGEGLDDAFVASGNGFGISYNQRGFYFRIDNIMVSENYKAYGCKVDDSIDASDHYPIFCWVAKRNK